MNKKILIPVDLAHDHTAELLAEGALELIDKEGGEIRFLYVDEILVHGAVSPLIGEKEMNDLESAAEAKLQGFLKEWDSQGVPTSYRIRRGSAHDRILDEARRIQADLIILAAGVPGISQYVLGTTAERVVRHADCSVYVIRE